jgi:hypothetical protein
MPRLSLLLLTALLVATGAGMIALASQGHPPAVGSVALIRADEAAVRRFYDAANQAIATGQLSALRTVVAPDFIDRAPLPGTEPGRAGLERRLTALHTLDPTARVSVDRVSNDGSIVVAHLTIYSGSQLSIAGLTTRGTPPIWPSVELFSVRAGRIVERHSEAGGVAALGQTQEIRLTLISATKRIGVERVTLIPGSELQLSGAEGPRALRAEAGEVIVDALTPAGPDALSVRRLAEGSSLALASGGDVRVRNEGSVTASLLVVTAHILPAPIPAAGTEPWSPPPGVSIAAVAPLLQSELDPGEIVVATANVTLLPGAELELERSGVVAMVLNDAGELTLAAGADAWISRRIGTNRLADGIDRLAPGDGAGVAGSGPLLAWNATDVPVTFTLLTLRPA